jgi:hypothetical protein
MLEGGALSGVHLLGFVAVRRIEQVEHFVANLDCPSEEGIRPALGGRGSL